MRKIFIDCGAHVGSSLVRFFTQFDDAAEYELYSFEVNPNLRELFADPKQILKDAEGFDPGRFTFIPKAVWIEDGKITLYQRTKEYSASSTISKQKYDLRRKKKKQDFNTVEVDSVDFSAWLERNFSKDDYIVLKMDIEGAEYEVLAKMHRDGTLAYVDEIYGELHNVKCGKTREDDQKLIDDLSEHGLTMYHWDAGSAGDVDLHLKKYDDEYVAKWNYTL